jgi:hypothetical protein
MRTLVPILLAAAVTIVGGPQSVFAQDAPPRHVSASLGVFSYNLSGTGVAPMLAVRGNMPVSSVLVLEAGIVGTRPDQVGRTAMFLAPEVQLQLAMPFERFAPYMGLGLGAVADFGGPEESEGASFDMAISGAVGSRFWLNERIGIQAEYRGRGIGFDFDGTSAEYSLGLAWRP